MVVRSIIPPKTSSGIIDYFCSWEHQGCFARGRRSSDLITETSMFEGDTPWCELFPEIRSELFFVMDDGWDVPLGHPQMKDYAALQNVFYHLGRAGVQYATWLKIES